ncbi:TPA: hypothetical protein L5Q18_004785 [Pseudomonas aeruginosa]|uniref:hypothetical protein n=3 Tax=Pseudomonas aeruginosa TaxID=287 RepID=UPI00106803D7|nr:hypothetical protein [Pseudomonas aeruginosa]TEB72948.1 hypothetical protein IPC1604_27520 [Pseudomonas aeruginosa]TEC17155.1 hypothetical protein IPC1599_28820 [Pseudomonas aeruginosa]HBP0650774.1 hypothetical protein [Pseudomonas aeruginosa]
MSNRRKRSQQAFNYKEGFISKIQSYKVRGQNNFREAFAKTRRDLPIESFPNAVHTLLGSSAYKNLATHITFPPDYSNFTNCKTIIVDLDPDKAFYWTALVLGEFKETLSSFALRQADFDESLLHGNYSRAQEILNEIEDEFGVSIWFITKKLTLLQLSEGRSAQKKYVQDTIDTNEFSILAAMSAYFISMALDESLSIAQLEEDMSSFLEIKMLREFALCNILPYKINEIEDPSLLLMLEETQPLIDRLQAFISMAQLFVAKNGINPSSQIFKSIKLLESIPDVRIKRLISLADPQCIASDGEYLNALDNYTLGNYSGDYKITTDTIGVVSAKFAQLNSPPPSGEDASVAQKIVGCIFNMLTSPAQRKSLAPTLRKLSLYAGQPIAIQMAEFIKNGQDYLFDDEIDELAFLAAIGGNSDNPRNSKLLRKLNPDFSAPRSDSVTRKLYAALESGYEEGVALIDSLGIPNSRAQTYKGHLAHINNDLETAINHYKAAIACSNGFSRDRINKNLFRALFNSSRIQECVDLVADMQLNSTLTENSYPLIELSKQMVDTPDLSFSIRAAMVIHLTSKLDPEWERVLSDYYENIMYSLGVSRPSELTKSAPSITVDELIYFLRFICIPRILDDTTEFENPDEIDQERILICQKLIELDPINKDSYSSEIRSITKDGRVTDALNHIEASNIYVDEDGLKDYVEQSIKERFSKYRELSESPEMEAQAEQMVKNIERILSERIELKNIEFPAIDRKGILSNMLHYFVHNFALNPAYGLDTHLSSSIRHGKFEGHVRHPLAVANLLCSRDKGKLIFPNEWHHIIPDLGRAELESLRKSLERFTTKIEDLISNYVTNLLHIKTDTQPMGMFDLFATDQDRQELAEKIDLCSNHKELVDVLLNYCWELTVRSLNKIQHEIDSSLRRSIHAACNQLIRSIQDDLPEEAAVILVNSVIHARIESDNALSEIKSWFKRPVKARQEPFDLELAIDVASKQIENCYAKHSAFITKEIDISKKIQGKYLGGVVEIMFILFQNVILHSGFGTNKNTINVAAKLSGDNLEVIVKSQIDDAIDLDELSEQASEAVSNYNQHTALKMARKEGGSGLSKIWRINEYFFKRESRVALSVSSDRVFNATLTILNVEGMIC